MKITVTANYNERGFVVAESDKDLEDVIEVEAVYDIFSSIDHMFDHLMDVEDPDSIKWKIEFGDILIASDVQLSEDESWIEMIRMIVYAIIKVVYKEENQISKYNNIGMMGVGSVPAMGYPNFGISGMTGYPVSYLGQPCQPYPYTSSLELIANILDPDMFEEFKKRKSTQSMINDVAIELDKMKKQRKANKADI